jgi:hypothetical protein
MESEEPALPDVRSIEWLGDVRGIEKKASINGLDENLVVDNLRMRRRLKNDSMVVPKVDETVLIPIEVVSEGNLGIAPQKVRNRMIPISAAMLVARNHERHTLRVGENHKSVVLYGRLETRVVVLAQAQQHEAGEQHASDLLEVVDDLPILRAACREVCVPQVTRALPVVLEQVCNVVTHDTLRVA